MIDGFCFRAQWGKVTSWPCSSPSAKLGGWDEQISSRDFLRLKFGKTWNMLWTLESFSVSLNLIVWPPAFQRKKGVVLCYNGGARWAWDSGGHLRSIPPGLQNWWMQILCSMSQIYSCLLVNGLPSHSQEVHFLDSWYNLMLWFTWAGSVTVPY